MNRSLHLVPRPQGQRPPADLRGMCANALEFHQRGELAEAERLYRKVLDLDPHHADSLHLLGVMAHQVGRDDLAVDLIGKAIAADKRPAAYHTNLGTAYQALGRLDEAAACYEQALARSPAMAEAEMNLGVVLAARGSMEAAEARLRRALELRPNLAEAHLNLGNVLQAQGKLEEAAASQERALALKPDSVEACFNRANILQAQGKLDEAVSLYRQTLTLKPQMAEAYGNLGNALLAQGRLDEAEECYARALELKPDSAEVWYNRGNARQARRIPDPAIPDPTISDPTISDRSNRGRTNPEQKKSDRKNGLEESAACYRRAIALKPQLVEAHYNLGNTLHALDRLEEAKASFERAIALRPEYAEAFYNLGCVLEDLGRLEDGLAAIARALEIKPEYPQARFGQALAELRGGDFSAGWRHYEHRWQSMDHDTPWRPYAEPLWNGGKLDSGRLLLWGEQGIGDEIQFAGLIPEAVRTGNRIVLDCDARLRPLFARSFPEVEVVSGCGPAKAGEMEIAAHLPTGSLPGIYRRSEAAFAATVSSYLKADAAERERFCARYGGEERIGLAWYTRSEKTGRKRSIGLEEFAPLFALPNRKWISLQYGDFDSLERQAAAAGAPLTIDRGVDQIADVDRFAAQVAAMDLVITIDNSTAHLAAALGVPVWLLLPFAADWRWMERRAESPWYPTMRLFRQPRLGDWETAIEDVRRALAESCVSR